MSSPIKLFILLLLCTSVSQAQLSVANSETIKVTSIDELFLQEELVNNGTITNLTLNGSNAFNISGTGTINNLVFNKTAGTATGIAGMQTITGLLTPTAGTLAAAGYFTLKSDVSATAYATSGAATISGLNIQHYLTSTQRGWRVVGNPFTTNVSLASLATASNIDITYTGVQNSYGATSGASSQTYSASNNTWTAISSGGNWTAQTPIALFIRGTKGEGITGSGAGWVSGTNYVGGGGTPSTVTLSAQGILNVAAANIIIAANKPNIVTNPFGAPISLTTVMAANSGLSAPIGYYSPVKGSTDVKVKSGGYETATPSGGSDIVIPPMGSFVVTSTGSTSLSIPTTAISLVTPTTGILGAGGLPNSVALKVAGATGVYYDKLNIVFDNKSTDASGDIYDFMKLANENFDLYSLSTNNNKLAYDNRKSMSDDQVIPLGIRSIQTGAYQFELLDNHLPIGTTVYLKDNFLHTQTELQEGNVTAFKVETDTLSQGEKRFELLFSNKKTGLTATESAVPGAFSADILGNITSNNTVAVKIAGNKGPVIISIHDVAGRSMGTVNAAEGTQQIYIGNTGTGMLLFEFNDGKTRIIKKLIKQ
ncbi:MAG: T9SS type A sorting domain-containing protein [Sediminibacterium sp.]